MFDFDYLGLLFCGCIGFLAGTVVFLVCVVLFLFSIVSASTTFLAPLAAGPIGFAYAMFIMRHSLSGRH
ncbi:MAG: hypothetical protein P1V13_22185 [Rhizobiaceae bacterium]|nr:hypothetical protein [Rhizobiaceae bacterium]